MTAATMRPCVFTFDDEQPFPGFTDGTTWNGFNNVSVTPEVRDAIVAHFRSGHNNPDTEAANVDMLALPVRDGLVSLGYGYATQILHAIAFHVGQRVSLASDVAPYPLGFLPKGACGTVVEVDSNADVGNPIVCVRMDDRFEILDDRDNALQVFRHADEASEVTEYHFCEEG